MMATADVLPRRRGRPRREPKVQTSVKVPASLYDVFARSSIRTGRSVHALMLQALKAYYRPRARQRHFR